MDHITSDPGSHADHAITYAINSASVVEAALFFAVGMVVITIFAFAIVGLASLVGRAASR